MDNLEICPCGKSNACYIQQVNESIKNKMCYGCGFLSNSLMKEGEAFFEEQYDILPELYKDLIWEDEGGYKWMPATINIVDKGIIFASGKDKENWKWGAAKATEIPEGEKSKYPNPTKPGTFYSHKTNMKTLKHFEQNEYIEALTYLGILPEDKE